MNKEELELIKNADSGIIQVTKGDNSWFFAKGDTKEINVNFDIIMAELYEDKQMSKEEFLLNLATITRLAIELGITVEELRKNFDMAIMLVKEINGNKMIEVEEKEYLETLKIKHERAYKIVKMNKQQKEFVKYLESMLDDENDIFSVVRVKDVLQKYKEIIGDDK